MASFLSFLSLASALCVIRVEGYCDVSYLTQSLLRCTEAQAKHAEDLSKRHEDAAGTELVATLKSMRTRKLQRLVQPLEERVEEVETLLQKLTTRINAIENKTNDMQENFVTVKSNLKDIRITALRAYNGIEPFYTSVTGGCKPSFLREGNDCINLYTSRKMTWTAARRLCQDLHGDLATPTDLRLQGVESYRKMTDSSPYVLSLLEKQRKRDQLNGLGAWLGARDEDEDGTLEWVTGGKVARTRDYKEQDKGLCLLLYIREDNKYQVLAEECSEKHYFFCIQ
ncbi:uncharacterized protein LOC143019759 [Oratosquilla oratoria]|uniref:uncharacterized protein LOC143019759 n=1 Tax=Oratosquilla oratoria TaxID=337810 RepID=UPI003F773818